MMMMATKKVMKKEITPSHEGDSDLLQKPVLQLEKGRTNFDYPP